MKTILVPTDFSENAHHAIEYAVELAGHLNANILLFNFFRVPIFAGDVPIEASLLEELEQESFDSLNFLKVEIMEKNSKLEVECISASSMNFEVEEICNVAIENGIDMIVMGTKGSSGLAKVLMGSNTAHVLENAHCPVLVVPEDARFDGLKKIVFATDYNEDDFGSIHFLKELADNFGAELIVVHLADEHSSTHHEIDRFNEFKRELSKHLPIDKMSFELIAGEDFMERLNEFIVDKKIDIMAMSTKKRNLYERLFDRSLTKQMAYHTKIPLLAFHLD